MEMSFGRYRGKPVAWVMIEDIGYFKWMKSQQMTDKPEYKFLLKLVSKFDSKPFSEERCCGSCKGKNTVTRLSLHSNKYNGLNLWWCDKCDPYESGATKGSLNTISKVSDIVRMRKDERNILMKLFASAKGVPKTKTKKALGNFFDYQY